jgi:predicted Rossmann fold flavoprotein
VNIIIIGGGAAGFFSAIHAASTNPDAKVIILEKTNKLLSKVKISGGGRCNVTHACFDLKTLSSAYPRGEKQLRSAFSKFMTSDTIEWFESRKVKLQAEADGRMFPTTNDSQTIIDCLLKEAKKYKIEIRTDTEVVHIESEFHGGFLIHLRGGEKLPCNKVVVATGGNTSDQTFTWLKNTGHRIVETVPSLFTFNLTDTELVKLQGVSVSPAKVSIANSKYEFSGPVLITHWGLSGPAVLKLSSYAARYLAEQEYSFQVQVNWLNDKKEEATRQVLFNLKAANPAKQINNMFPFVLPSRLLDYIFEKSGLHATKKWGEISKEDINRLAKNLLFDTYEVKGKTTFKEEFVTCGGVSLEDVDFKSMQSRKMKGIHFAGEVLDIDGITGGFNFQAAWTTGYIAGKAAAN